MGCRAAGVRCVVPLARCAASRFVGRLSVRLADRASERVNLGGKCSSLEARPAAGNGRRAACQAAMAPMISLYSASGKAAMVVVRTAPTAPRLRTNVAALALSGMS